MVSTTTDRPTYDSDAEAAAALLAEHLRLAGVVDAAAADGQVVGMATHGGGYHAGNLAGSYDAEAHLMCDPAAVNRGPLAGDMPTDATVYVNWYVHGLKSPDTDGWGHALPTHNSRRAGVSRRDREELPPRVRAAADRLGIYD